MNVIGLTGGIACGKSTVAGMLVQKGALVIDADQLAREAVEPGEQAWKEIIQWLGDTVAGEDGSLDRKKIASIVFKDEKSLAKLNSIIHPRVLELFYQRSSELEKELPGRLLVWDIPLLFETGYDKRVDYIVVVASSEEVQIQRLSARDGLSREEAIRRIRSQLEIEKKIEKADFVICNNGTKDLLKEKVDLLWEKLRAIC
ncbi:MAG: dephospho-CoA kinase [Firmicutes bacterium]|jgi:dephospho-CoA kinase|nr:dephospho-CoA kinase [Bacillota bacterium]